MATTNAKNRLGVTMMGRRWQGNLESPSAAGSPSQASQSQPSPPFSLGTEIKGFISSSCVFKIAAAEVVGPLQKAEKGVCPSRNGPLHSSRHFLGEVCFSLMAPTRKHPRYFPPPERDILLMTRYLISHGRNVSPADRDVAASEKVPPREYHSWRFLIAHSFASLKE